MSGADFIIKTGALHNGHDLTLDTAHGKAESGSPQAGNEHGQGFFSRGVHVIDTLGIQKDVAQVRLFVTEFDYLLIKIAGVGKKQCAIKTDHGNVTAALQAIVLGAFQDTFSSCMDRLATTGRMDL